MVTAAWIPVTAPVTRAGIEGATTSEYDADAEHCVIDLMEEQKTVRDLGGTMRLGAFDCTLTEGSISRRAYGQEKISERHRHRFELDPQNQDARRLSASLDQDAGVFEGASQEIEDTVSSIREVFGNDLRGKKIAVSHSSAGISAIREATCLLK